MTQHNQNPNPTSQVDDDEIDLMALAKTVWKGRKTIIKTTLIFMGIGLLVAIFSEKEYTASTTFVPQTSDSKIGGSLGGLAAMAGINLGGMNSNSGISPDLYPQIISSIPFQKELLETPLTIKGEKGKITFKEYYTNVKTPGLLGYIKKYTIGLPGLIIKALKGSPKKDQPNVNSQLLMISEDEKGLIEQLSGQLELSVNDVDGSIMLSAKMPEATASAELAIKTEKLLQSYVIDFEIEKSKEQLEFIKKRYEEVEKKFKKIQYNVASYQDKNKYISTALGKTRLQMLLDEYDLIYGVYSELAKQFEAQYLQVTKDTPVFTVIKPVSVPTERSKPKRKIILMIWVFLGGVCGIGIVFGRKIQMKN